VTVTTKYNDFIRRRGGNSNHIVVCLFAIRTDEDDGGGDGDGDSDSDDESYKQTGQHKPCYVSVNWVRAQGRSVKEKTNILRGQPVIIWNRV